MSKTDNHISTTKKLGFFSLFSVAIGIIIAQTGMLPLLQTAAITQSGFFIALGCAYLLGITYILSFAELSLMFPRAGGLATYTEAALGNLPAIVAVFSAYVIPPMLGIAAEIYLLDTVLNQLYPGVFPTMSVGYTTLLLFATLNLFGINVFSKLQNLIVILMVSVIFFLAVASLTTGSAVTTTAPSDVFNPMGTAVFSMIALAIWCMIGTEFTTFMVEEAKNPRKHIPFAMISGLTVIFLLYLGLGYGALRVLGSEAISASATPHILLITTLLGKGGTAIAAAIAITATASCVNTVMASIPSMLCGMANNKQVLPQFAKLSRFNSPWVGIVFMTMAIAIPLGFMQHHVGLITTLLISASVSWFLAYLVSHVNVIVLRVRQPQLSRPFKTPFFPVPQVVGIFGFLYISMNCSPSPEATTQIYMISGGLILFVTVFAAVWVKFFMKERLFTAVPIPQNA